MTHVVCDSGPLTHLWQVGLWSTLHTFETLHVAQQVIQEIREHVSLDRLESLSNCKLHIHTISQQEIDVQRQRVPSDLKLQIADLATLALAQRVTPDLVLTDDLDLRRAVESRGQIPNETHLFYHVRCTKKQMQRTWHDSIFTHANSASDSHRVANR